MLKYTIGEYPYPLTKLPSEGNSSPWRIHASKLTLHPTPVTLEEIGLIYRSLANRTLILSPKSLKSANSYLIHMSMKKYDPKTRLTVTVDGRILKKAKEEAKKRRIPISRLIENFLRFFAKPEVYCFKCGEKFSSAEAELCPKCGWMICPKCKACRCSLSEETAIAVFHMRRVYEDLLMGRLK